MIDRVSRAARVSRCGFTRRKRRTYSAEPGSVRSCQPPATSCRTIPETPSRSSPESLSSAPAMRSLSMPVVWCSSSTDRGRSATNSTLSSTVRTRSGERRRLFCTSLSKGVSKSGSRSSMSAASTCSSSASPAGAVTAAISSSENGPGPPGLSGSGVRASLPVLILVHLRRGQVRQRIPLRGEEDLLRVRLLEDADQLELHHFQDGQEGGDDLLARPLALEQGEEGKLGDGAEPLRDALDRLGDAHALADDLMLELGGGVLQHPIQGLDQLVDGDLHQADLILRDGDLFDGDPPREHVAIENVVSPERLRGLLVLLVLEEAAHQLGPRIACLLRQIGLGQGLLLTWEEQPALDVRERGGHHQELARDVQVQLAHPLQVLEVLLGDQRDRNVEDVDPLLPDQMEQEIQRAFEVRQGDSKGIGDAGLCGPIHFGTGNLASAQEDGFIPARGRRSTLRRCRGRALRRAARLQRRPTASRTRWMMGTASSRARRAPLLMMRATPAGG